jgi:hypothetical protein
MAGLCRLNGVHSEQADGIRHLEAARIGRPHALDVQTGVSLKMRRMRCTESPRAQSGATMLSGGAGVKPANRRMLLCRRFAPGGDLRLAFSDGVRSGRDSTAPACVIG